MRLDGGLAALLALGLAVSNEAARANPAGFQPGEGFTFTLAVGPVPAGKARLSVGWPTRVDGRHLAVVHGEAHSADWMRFIARLDDDYKVVFDADALTPKTVASHETGIRERSVETVFDGARFTIDFRAAKGGQHQNRVLTDVPRDPMTALFWLRGARLRDGDVLRGLVLDGPAVYRSTTRVIGRERLIRDQGPVDAIRLAIEAVRIDDRGRSVAQAPRHITLWLSDDDRRLPWRISGDTDLGTAEVVLTSYRGPSASPPTEKRTDAKPAEAPRSLLRAPRRPARHAF